MRADLGLLTIVGLIFVVVLIGIAMIFRFERRKQEIKHLERMTALKTGQPLPDEDWVVRMKTLLGWGTPENSTLESPPKNFASAIGVWIPAAALGLAWMASGNPTTKGAGDAAMWLAAGAVGVAGIVCGTFLATRSEAPTASTPTAKSGLADSKPFDLDAYDVVSRRERTST